jgi:DNA-binding Lrp family transcriptional regulator
VSNDHNHELSQRDNELLKELQDNFQVSPRPYLAVAERLGWTEDQVIKGIQDLLAAGVIRKFGAKLAPRKMGFVSTLAAVEVPDNDVDSVAEIINEYPGVTHNYLREGSLNLWFTLTEPDHKTLSLHLEEIENKTGLSVIRMPATKVFKIGVKFDI